MGQPSLTRLSSTAHFRFELEIRMMKFILLLTVLLIPSKVLASSHCNCSGEAEVIGRTQIPKRGYVKNVYSVARDSFERVLKIIPTTLKCEGYGCCPEPANPLFVRVKSSNNAQATGMYPVIFEGEDQVLLSLHPGTTVSFAFSCADSVMGGGASFSLK